MACIQVGRPAKTLGCTIPTSVPALSELIGWRKFWDDVLHTLGRLVVVECSNRSGTGCEAVHVFHVIIPRAGLTSSPSLKSDFQGHIPTCDPLGGLCNKFDRYLPMYTSWLWLQHAAFPQKNGKPTSQRYHLAT